MPDRSQESDPWTYTTNPHSIACAVGSAGPRTFCALVGISSAPESLYSLCSSEAEGRSVQFKQERAARLGMLLVRPSSEALLLSCKMDFEYPEISDFCCRTILAKKLSWMSFFVSHEFLINRIRSLNVRVFDLRSVSLAVVWLSHL